MDPGVETYYDSKEKYSLRSMTSTEYIRDPRFRAHMVAVIDPYGKPFCVMHDAIPEFFASIPWERTALLAHNMYFDGLITSDVYGKHAAYYLDTLSMSLGYYGLSVRHSLEALCQRLKIKGKLKGVLETSDGVPILSAEQEEALAEYAVVDVEQCYEAFNILREEKDFPADELDIIDTTIKAYVRPLIVVDRAMCEAEIEAERLKLENLFNLVEVGIDELSDTCRAKFQAKGLDGLLASGPCFAELLKQRGIAPPMKPSPTNPDKMTYAFGKTDHAFQMLQEDPRVGALCDARVGSKSTIRRTRAERFLADSVNGTKPLPVPLKTYGARTHRWSGFGNINLQNLPSGRGGTSSRLRQALTAPKGYRFVVVDASQIECRYNGFVWGEDNLVNAFATGEDPYSQLAAELYGMPVGKHGPNVHLRATGKAMELGLGYGMGNDKFYMSCITGSVIGQKVDITPEQAEQAVHVYRTKRSKIVDGWRQLNFALVHMATANQGAKPHTIGPWEFHRNSVLMPNGLMMHYPDLHYETRKVLYKEVIKDDHGEPILDSAGEEQYREVWKNKTELVYMMMGQSVRIWGSKLDENLIQSSTRTIVAERALPIAREFPVVLLVHDEVVYLAKDSEADDALKFGIETLRQAPDWCAGIPLDAEGGHSERYDVK